MGIKRRIRIRSGPSTDGTQVVCFVMSSSTFRTTSLLFFAFFARRGKNKTDDRGRIQSNQLERASSTSLPSFLRLCLYFFASPSFRGREMCEHRPPFWNAFFFSPRFPSGTSRTSVRFFCSKMCETSRNGSNIHSINQSIF